MNPPASPSRRRLLSAGVWSVPAVVLASAAPSYAASGATYTLSVVRVGANGVKATVTLSAAARPVVAGTVSLELQRLSGPGEFYSGVSALGWTVVLNAEDDQQYRFLASPGVGEVSVFSFSMLPPSGWRLTLTSPTGTYSQHVQIDAAAPGVRMEPVPQGPDGVVIAPPTPAS